MNEKQIAAVCGKFIGSEKVTGIEMIPTGHINTTYRISGEKRDYILQRVNTSIFTDAEKLICNISGVTEFLRKKITAYGGDPDRETLTLLKTEDGDYLYSDGSGKYRMYLYITGATCYSKAVKEGMFGESAKAFGRFQNLLADYDAKTLYETIKDFHNTPVRFSNFERAVNADVIGRKKDCLPEVEFFLARGGYCDKITSRLADGRIPTRVTHNDTKLNNVMIDDKTGKGICVIDLDTVMPGSMLYDYGDSIRFGASSAAEDETDLEKVYCVPALYEEYTAGFLSEVRSSITEEEARCLHDGAIMMTLECGMRFLTDYLEGDTYFRTTRPGQNLDRARTQIKLVADMENRRSEFESIIAKHL